VVQPVISVEEPVAVTTYIAAGHGAYHCHYEHLQCCDQVFLFLFLSFHWLCMGGGGSWPCILH